MEICGTFVPPLMGHDTVPIPIVGPGRIEIRAQGLSLLGYRIPRRLRMQLARRFTAAGVGFAVLLILTFVGMDQGITYLTTAERFMQPAVNEFSSPQSQFSDQEATKLVEGVGSLIYTAIAAAGLFWLWREVKAIHHRSVNPQARIELLIPWSCVQGIRTATEPRRRNSGQHLFSLVMAPQRARPQDPFSPGRDDLLIDIAHFDFGGRLPFFHRSGGALYFRPAEGTNAAEHLLAAVNTYAVFRLKDG